MNGNGLLPVDRFLTTLDIVSREITHLNYSYHKLFSQSIDVNWVCSLNDNPDIAEQLEAFVSRFGRLQDTIADKLLPRWLSALAETPGSQIETLNRAERLGIIESVDKWLQARKLRNRLVHEYMESEEDFAEDILAAKEYSVLLVESYNHLCEFAEKRMSISTDRIPKKLMLLNSDQVE